MSERNNQKGMTLVELLVALTITAVIIGGLSIAIYMITSVTERGNADTSALHNMEKVAYWISNDARMANTTDLSDGGSPADSITLQWIDGNGNNHYSHYWLSGTNLQRDYDGVITVVAWDISSIEFSISGDILTFRTESTPPTRWQLVRAATGKVNLRPD